MAKDTQWFGGEKLKPQEKAVLRKIDATRVKSFMESIQRLMVVKRAGKIEVADLGAEYELPESSREQTKVEEHFGTRTASELLWAGMTVKGVGVAFIGTGATEGNHGKRMVPEIGIIADPKRDKTLLIAAKLWNGNADDGWDSGWDQHSYQAADWDKKVSAYKPVDEWGASWNRGYYNLSLLHDPHFLLNGELHKADIHVSAVGYTNAVQATLGHDLVRVQGDKGYPAYNFDRQITPEDVVLKMNHAILTSYSSD